MRIRPKQAMTPKKDEYMRGYGDGFKDGRATASEPDLLDALMTIASVDDDGFTSDGHERCSEIAARAISKAEGRSS